MDKEPGTPQDEWTLLRENSPQSEPETSDWRFRKLGLDTPPSRARSTERAARRQFSSTHMPAPALEERMERLGWSVVAPASPLPSAPTPP